MAKVPYVSTLAVRVGLRMTLCGVVGVARCSRCLAYRGASVSQSVNGVWSLCGS
jgi:hypothetical protein